MLGAAQPLPIRGGLEHRVDPSAQGPVVGRDRERDRCGIEPAVDDQLAAGGDHPGQSVHRRAGHPVEGDLDSLPAGDLVDQRDQILLLGGDHLSGAGVEQTLPLGAGTGRGDRHRAEMIRDLDRGEPHRAGGRRDQDGIAGPQPGDVDQGAVGGQVGVPDGRAGDRVDPFATHQGRCRDHRLVGVDTVVAHRERRHGVHRFPDREPRHIGAQGIDHPGGLGADPGPGPPRQFVVGPAAEPRLAPVQADGLHPDPNLTRARFGQRHGL
ncbi:MAG TPA: hypothetical protein VK020_11220, partial [Microlunatus sp.]|nr:hypothetical protein [Microlunatus sp.]